MVAQAKILRVLRLIALLKSRSKSIEELARSLETTPRTIYRYLDLLEELGFIIDKDWNNRFFIHTSEEEEPLNFTTDEAIFLQNLIKAGSGNNPIKESLLKKLFVNSELEGVSEEILNARLGKLVNILTEALNKERQVILKNYHSAHSGEIRDRLVEPVSFNQEYDTLIAFEVNDKSNKSFKIERIGNVQLLEHPMKFKQQHSVPKADIFGISSGEYTEITLRLSLRAYLLMREEYPQSIHYLNREDEVYTFNGPVRGFSGITRFILGLINECEVVGPGSLKEHLNQLIRDKKF